MATLDETVNAGDPEHPNMHSELAVGHNLDETHRTLTTSAHGGIVASTDARLTDARTPTDNSVTTAKLVNGAVTAAKVASDVVVTTGDQTIGGVKTFSADRIQVGDVLLIRGTGSPEGVEAAPVGSWFFRSDGGSGTVAYRKEAGADVVGWVADVNGAAHPDLDAHDALGLVKQDELDTLGASVVKLSGAQTIAGAKTFGETVTFSDGANIAGGATTGIRVATAADQKLAFFGATPVVQPGVNADTSGASIGELETEVNELKALLRSLGLLATSAPPAGGNKGYLGGYTVGY